MTYTERKSKFGISCELANYLKNQDRYDYGFTDQVTWDWMCCYELSCNILNWLKKRNIFLGFILKYMGIK